MFDKKGSGSRLDRDIVQNYEILNTKLKFDIKFGFFKNVYSSISNGESFGKIIKELCRYKVMNC